MSNTEEITEMINALEEMSCEHAFSHGQMAVKELIPKMIKVLEKEIPQKPIWFETEASFHSNEQSYECSSCGYTLHFYKSFSDYEDSLGQVNRYCKFCGQRLDQLI